MTKNAAFIVSNPTSASSAPRAGKAFPIRGCCSIPGLVVAALVLSRTIYGHVIYGVGGNIEASRLSGLRVPLIVGSTYVLLGALTGIAGFISASQLSSAQANMDPNILFDVLTIVIVGGTPLGGGVGSIGRTAIGLVLIATISNGFVLLDINPFYQNIIKGVLIVGALVFDSTLKRLARASDGSRSISIHRSAPNKRIRSLKGGLRERPKLSLKKQRSTTCTRGSRRRP